VHGAQDGGCVSRGDCSRHRLFESSSQTRLRPACTRGKQGSTTGTASRMLDGLSEDSRTRPEKAKLGKNDLIIRHRRRHGSFLQPWDENVKSWERRHAAGRNATTGYLQEV